MKWMVKGRHSWVVVFKLEPRNHVMSLLKHRSPCSKTDTIPGWSKGVAPVEFSLSWAETHTLSSTGIFSIRDVVRKEFAMEFGPPHCLGRGRVLSHETGPTVTQP